MRGFEAHREPVTPHPTPLPVGEGADRVCGTRAAGASDGRAPRIPAGASDHARRRHQGARRPPRQPPPRRRHRSRRQHPPRHRGAAHAHRRQPRGRAARHQGRRPRDRDRRRGHARRARRASRRGAALSGGGAGRRRHRRADPSPHGHGRRQSLPRHPLHLLQSERMVALRQSPLPQDHRGDLPRRAQEPRRLLRHLQW